MSSLFSLAMSFAAELGEEFLSKNGGKPEKLAARFFANGLACLESMWVLHLAQHSLAIQRFIISAMFPHVLEFY